VKGFRFRLGRVLNVRRIEDDVARTQWLHGEAQAVRAETELERASAELSGARTQLALLRETNPLHPADLLWRETAVDSLREVAVRRRVRASLLRREADVLRAAWQARRSARRGLENLEERAREAFAGEETIRENRAMDDRVHHGRPQIGASGSVPDPDDTQA
jgi:flagellar export protein FliJ